MEGCGYSGTLINNSQTLSPEDWCLTHSVEPAECVLSWKWATGCPWFHLPFGVKAQEAEVEGATEGRQLEAGGTERRVALAI